MLLLGKDILGEDLFLVFTKNRRKKLSTFNENRIINDRASSFDRVRTLCHGHSFEPRHNEIIKSNLSLYSLYYTKACNKLIGPISASLHHGNIALFKRMSHRWQAVGNTVSNLSNPRFEPQTSRSRDERATA